MYIIGTERHESRRIDNQLRGRSGRQGDPGKSRFYLSTEDDLMRLFGGERMEAVMNRLNTPDDMPIETSCFLTLLKAHSRRLKAETLLFVKRTSV